MRIACATPPRLQFCAGAVLVVGSAYAYVTAPEAEERGRTAASSSLLAAEDGSETELGGTLTPSASPAV